MDRWNRCVQLRWVGVVLSLSMVGVCAATDDAGGADTAVSGDLSDFQIIETTDDENIGFQIERSERARYDSVFGELDRPLFTTVREWKAYLDREIGLELSFEYTLIYQAASGGIEPRDTAVGTLTFAGKWKFYREGDGVDGAAVGWAIEHRANYTDATGVDFAGGVGSIWSPNDSSSGSYDRIRQLWVGQRLLDGRLGWVAGKVDPGAYLNTSTYAGSGNTRFFSQPFATNPARVFPENGLGVFVSGRPTESFYITGGVSDGTARDGSNPFDTVDDGRVFFGIEVGYETEIEGVGPGTYRVTGWSIDTKSGDAAGVALSFDQQLTPELGVFLRYAYTDGDVGAIRHLLATGVAFIEPFGRADDSAGVGFSYTDPMDNDLRDEFHTEAYYRLAISSGISLSGSIQLIFDPSAGEQDLTAVYGVRLNILY